MSLSSSSIDLYGSVSWGCGWRPAWRSELADVSHWLMGVVCGLTQVSITADKLFKSREESRLPRHSTVFIVETTASSTRIASSQNVFVFTTTWYGGANHLATKTMCNRDVNRVLEALSHNELNLGTVVAGHIRKHTDSYHREYSKLQTRTEHNIIISAKFTITSWSLSVSLNYQAS